MRIFSYIFLILAINKCFSSNIIIKPSIFTIHSSNGKDWMYQEKAINVFGFGISSFDQTISRYNIYNIYNDLWGEFTNTDAINLENLNANWIEIGFGIKTEILNNLFLGIELQLKNLIYQKNKNDIANFYIPGFNRTYESSNFGTGFNYSLTYLIPIIKK